jgi:hypothetical protein
MSGRLHIELEPARLASRASGLRVRRGCKYDRFRKRIVGGRVNLADWGYGVVNWRRSAQKSRSEKSELPVEACTIRNEFGTSVSSSGLPGVPL